MRFLFFILLICCCNVQAQNLVPNPSFEDTVNCPMDGEIPLCDGWSAYRPTPDYYNSCTESQDFGIPKNYGGYQLPATGHCYTGLSGFGNSADYKEMIGRKLSIPLVIGEKYFVSMKVSLSNQSLFASNKLGISFSTIKYDDFLNYAPINNNATIYTNSIITDTANWQVISGSFIADSQYQYIRIGNSFDDLHTDTLRVLNPAIANHVSASYYYIDDVCVSKDSTECLINTSVNKASLSDNFSIYPNPSTDKLYIGLNSAIKYRCSIISIMGVEFFSKELTAPFCIDLTNIPSGFYLLQIQVKDKTIQHKQIIIH